MNTLEDYLDKIVTALQKLEGAPAILLVLIGCIVAGYGLKCWSRFPNQAIPLAVILLGGLAYPLIADDNNDITLRVWLVRNALIGVAVGFGAWMLHNQVLSRVEEKLGLFIGSEKADAAGGPKT